jgi:hypothetical protein
MIRAEECTSFFTIFLLCRQKAWFYNTPVMEKTRWLDYLSSKLKSQISLENARQAQNWALVFLCLFSLGFALHALKASETQAFIYATKVLFLIFFHGILIASFYLPSLLQKGEKPVARFLEVRDFTGLMVISMVLTFYTVVAWILSFQVAAGAGEMGLSNYFGFVAWTNLLVAFFYLGIFLFYFSSLFFFPGVLVKWIERSAKGFYALLILHAVLLFFLGFGYAETTPIGSPNFFEQFRVAGLFWVFIGSSVLFLGKWLRESSVEALAALELEIASGKLERSDEILLRLKEAFVSRRLFFWVNRLTRSAAAKAHQIAQLTHEAVSLVSREKPAELDLRQVEDRYRKADAVSKKLEKENQRFLLSISFFESSETEREKIGELRDRFSRESRNAKLELAGVRKRIDERLVALKNIPPQPLASEVPVEQQVPVGR